MTRETLPSLSSKASYQHLLSLRGGANKNKKKKQQQQPEPEPEEEVEDDDEEEEDTSLEEGSGVGGSGEGKTNLVSSYLHDFYLKTPPFTRLYLFSTLSLTLFCFLFNRNQWPEIFTFSWSGIFPNFQIWRLATGFLYFGALDLFYPLTLQFVWQHMSQLEKMSYKSPEDFMIMIGFGMMTLITIYSLTGISMRYLGHNLATYLVYIWSRVFEGMDVNFMDLFTLKSELMPWFFVIQTFLLEQEIPFADLLGIVVGHLYSYLKQKKILQAPQGMKAFFAKPYWKDQYERFKGEFE